MTSFAKKDKAYYNMKKRSARIMVRNDKKRMKNLSPQNLSKSLKSPNSQAKDNLFSIAASFVESLAEVVYGYFSDQEEHSHLLKNKQEISDKIRRSGGVLYHRLTRMEPDSRGVFIPVKYIGIEIVGEGPSEALARLDYNDRIAPPVITETTVCTGDNPFGSPMSCKTIEEYDENFSFPVKKVVCTPMNPTGQSMRSQAYLSAAPAYSNNGYKRQVSYEVEKIYNINPRNQGQVNFGSKTSPIQPKAFLQTDLFFISEEKWKAINPEYGVSI